MQIRAESTESAPSAAEDEEELDDFQRFGIRKDTDESLETE